MVADAVLALGGKASAQQVWFIAPLFECRLNHALQVKSLADLRDTLLPRLISGKLRLPEAESMLKEAVA